MRRWIAIAMWALCMATAMHGQPTAYTTTPPAHAEILPGYTVEAVKTRLDTSPIDQVEGIWEFPDDCTTLVVERLDDSRFSSQFRYRIVLLDAENNRSAIPGTVMGYIVPTAQSDKMYVWLYSGIEDEVFAHPVKCAATLDGDCSVLTFTKPTMKLKIRMNLARLLPTLFKGLSVSVEPQTPGHPLGFRKIYPADNIGTPHQIIYL